MMHCDCKPSPMPTYTPWNQSMGITWPTHEKKCLNCGGHNGNGVQCISLKVTS